MPFALRRLISLLGLASLLAFAGVACQGNVVNPTSPSVLSSSFSVPGSAASPFGGHALPLIEVPGSVPAGGSGRANATGTGKPGTNNFEVTLNVHGAPPDTDLFFQIRTDAGLGPAQGRWCLQQGGAARLSSADFTCT